MGSDHEKPQSGGPSHVRPLAKFAAVALLAGFALVALGQDPVTLAAGAGQWIIDSIGALALTEVP